MHDTTLSPASPAGPTANVRKPLKGSPRSPSFKRRSAPASSPLKAIIPEDAAVGNQEMAASFLQYCAMCEKQILTPSNSILYCSDACRRKDSCKPLALAAVAMSPPITPPSSVPSSPRPIHPLRTLTGTMTVSTSSIRIPADLNNAKSDFDAAEWKPKLRGRGESDAFRYLSQFHRSTSTLGTTDTQDDRPARRPLLSLRTTASLASMTPSSLSLSQTPSTPSSSLSPAAEYDFNTRPLQSRHNPMYSASAGTTKGIDLVMPYVAPSLATSLPTPGKGSQVREDVCCQDVCVGWRRAACFSWS
jgi:ECL1/2/3 zinc binding proteins